MSDKATVHEALSHVMEDVQAVRKGDLNKQQGYSFRGIDAVVNAVGPALRKHGVVVVPVAEDLKSETYTSKYDTAMRNVTVRVRWVFYGPAGDSIEAVTFGEAADAGDKAVAKAHSVAYRVALLQALCIPTDEPDPDSTAHERAVPQTRQSPPQPDPAARRRALEMRDKVLAATTRGELSECWRQAGKAALPVVVENEHGDDEELGALIKRRSGELPADRAPEAQEAEHPAEAAS